VQAKRFFKTASVLLLLVLVNCSDSNATSTPTVAETLTSSSVPTDRPVQLVPITATHKGECPLQVIVSSDSQVSVPGSSFRLKAGNGVSGRELSAISQYVCIARVVRGDAGPLTVYIFTEPHEFAVAFQAAGAGSHERATRLLSAGVRATVRAGEIWLTPNIAKPGPSLAQTVFHEYFHLLQAHLAGRIALNAPDWLLEGTGVYFGYALAQAYGFDDLVGRLARAKTAAGSIVQPLSAFEKSAGVPSSSAYSMGLVAADLLVKTYGDRPVEHELWKAMHGTPDWKLAFANTFGTSVEEFYRHFETYKQSNFQFYGTP
jgi:hypothetical protein